MLKGKMDCPKELIPPFVYELQNGRGKQPNGIIESIGYLGKAVQEVSNSNAEFDDGKIKPALGLLEEIFAKYSEDQQSRKGLFRR